MARRRRQTEEFVERRQRRDWVSRSVSILSVVGWLCSMIALLFLESAQPDKENFFTRIFNTPVRSYWNSSILRFSMISLTLSFVVCAVGMVFNMMRNRRKSDKYNPSIIALGIFSLGSIVIFLWRFGVYL